MASTTSVLSSIHARQADAKSDRRTASASGGKEHKFISHALPRMTSICHIADSNRLGYDDVATLLSVLDMPHAIEPTDSNASGYCSLSIVLRSGLNEGRA
jgi:hypothetical protein